MEFFRVVGCGLPGTLSSCKLHNYFRFIYLTPWGSVQIDTSMCICICMYVSTHVHNQYIYIDRYLFDIRKQTLSTSPRCPSVVGADGWHCTWAVPALVRRSAVLGSGLGIYESSYILNYMYMYISLVVISVCIMHV